MLDHAYSAKGEEGLSWIMVEFRRLLVELGIGARSWREGTLGGEIDAIGDVLLEVDDEFGREDIL
jgi:hypothetical protein